MGAGKVFAFLGGLLTLVGTYVFAFYPWGTGEVGSGISFAMNIPDLFTNADTYAASLTTQVWLFYIYLVIFIIFLASGVLQMLSIQSRAVGFIFSLFPLGVGVMFIMLAYTDFLGVKAAFFDSFFHGEQFGGFYPILVNLGDLALGVYLILAGGVLGVLSVFMERD
ncbi:MAG: hypothetical protein HWN81_02405 [Candidatus Lokiarchaeota archaeon]|nr:hypothetical protein [Candidatus Lokiarchaeota archaeon]